MVALRCPNCKANISIDDSREFGFCSYCGAKVQLVQTVKMVHEGTVNIPGVKSDEQILASAKKMIDIGENGEAKRLLKKLVETSPDCGEAWLWLAYIKYYDRYYLEWRNDYFSKKASLAEVKEKALSIFEDSSEVEMAKKLLNENDNLLLTGVRHFIENKVEKYILDLEKESKEKNNKLYNNWNLLLGFYADVPENPSKEKCFFTYYNRLYLLTDLAYYVITDISDDGIIHCTFDRLACFSKYIYDSPVSKYLHLRLGYMSDDELIIEHLGYMIKCGASIIDRMSRLYKNAIYERDKKFVCPICGGKLSLFGDCYNKCSLYIK